MKIVLSVGINPVAASEGIGGDQVDQMATMGEKKLVPYDEGAADLIPLLSARCLCYSWKQCCCQPDGGTVDLPGVGTVELIPFLSTWWPYHPWKQCYRCQPDEGTVDLRLFLSTKCPYHPW